MGKRTRRNVPAKRIESKLLDIVILVYNRFDLLQKCLDAIPRATMGIDYNVILVDNASDPDVARDFYAKCDPNYLIVRNRENLGFPKGCNIGAKRKASPLLLMLNSDVVLEQEATNYMIQALDADQKVGVVGAKLLFPTAEQLSEAGMNPKIRPAGMIQHIGMETNIRGEFYHIFLGWSPDHPKVNKMRETYAVTGACLLTRRTIWNRIGGFYEGYGQGCLVGDTLIYTNTGIRELSDFSTEWRDRTLVPINIEIASENDNRVSNLFYENGLEQTLKVTLEKNFSIQGTPNHKIRIMSNDGKIIWKSLDELKIGDYVAIRYGMNLFGNNHLDEDDAYLMGLYISEGSNERNKIEKTLRVSITSADFEIGNFLAGKYEFKRGKDGIHWRKNGQDFVGWMSQFVDFSKRSFTKEIPKFFLQADKETQIAFLQGLFDGDGCAIHDGRVTYSSSSLILIKQLQSMLLNFGIVVGFYPRISGKSRVNYLMDFGSNSGDFYSKIGFRLQRKQERKKFVRPSLSPNIPNQRDHFKKLYSELDDKDWKELGMHENNPATGVRRDTIELLVDQAFKNGKTWRDPDLDHFGQILLYDCVWLKVKSIEDGGEELTYDLHIPTNHAYVANGLIVHNTYEDTDFCLTVRELGYNIIVEPKAVGTHYTGATAEKYQMPMPLQMNKFMFMQRWGNKLNYTEANRL